MRGLGTKGIICLTGSTANAPVMLPECSGSTLKTLLGAILLLVLLLPFKQQFFSQSTSSFFPAPAPKFLWEQQEFFSALHTKLLRRTIMSFKNKKITFDCDEATDMKIKSLLGNKSYLNSRDYQNLFQSIINRTYETFKGKQFK